METSENNDSSFVTLFISRDQSACWWMYIIWFSVTVTSSDSDYLTVKTIIYHILLCSRNDFQDHLFISLQFSKNTLNCAEENKPLCLLIQISKSYSDNILACSLKPRLYFYFLWDYWTHSDYFKIRIPLELVFRALFSLATYIFTGTEYLIFGLLCLLCFQRQLFRFVFLCLFSMMTD